MKDNQRKKNFTMMHVPVAMTISVDHKNGESKIIDAEYIDCTADELARALIQLNGGKIPGTNIEAVGV